MAVVLPRQLERGNRCQRRQVGGCGTEPARGAAASAAHVAERPQARADFPRRRIRCDVVGQYFRRRSCESLSWRRVAGDTECRSSGRQRAGPLGGAAVASWLAREAAAVTAGWQSESGFWKRTGG